MPRRARPTFKGILALPLEARLAGETEEQARNRVHKDRLLRLDELALRYGLGPDFPDRWFFLSLAIAEDFGVPGFTFSQVKTGRTPSVETILSDMRLARDVDRYIRDNPGKKITHAARALARRKKDANGERNSFFGRSPNGLRNDYHEITGDTDRRRRWEALVALAKKEKARRSDGGLDVGILQGE